MTTNLINAKVTVPATTASRTFGAHMSDHVDVKSFGAVGDGTTDDTVAIQAAVTYACNNGKTLIFPNTSIGSRDQGVTSGTAGAYKITDQIVIPWGTHNWSIQGEGGHAQILQATDNKPFIHFDSLSNNTSGLTNGEFSISNFAVSWVNSQAVANTHAAVLEFNDGGYADFIAENLTCCNGVRCITHQFPGQTVGRVLNVWGCIFRHLYMQFSSTGAAVYLRSNPTEGLPNILIEHVYSVQSVAGEELIHIAGATGVTIINVEQNFNSYTPGFTGWAGTGNVDIINWRVEQFHWIDGGATTGYFVCNGSGATISEYSISNFEMRFNTINLTADKYVIQTSGARVKFNGLLDTGTTNTAGFVNLIQLGAAGDIAEAGISTIQGTNVRFCKASDSNLSNIQFSGGTRAMRFYKNSLTTSMTAVINDDPSNIKGQAVAQAGWLWSLRVDLNAAVTAGSVQAVVFKNGSAVDSTNYAVTITSGTTGSIFNAMLKNQNSTAFQVVAGDVIDVRITTSGTMAGPANAVVAVVIANI